VRVRINTEYPVTSEDGAIFAVVTDGPEFELGAGETDSGQTGVAGDPYTSVSVFSDTSGHLLAVIILFRDQVREIPVFGCLAIAAVSDDFTGLAGHQIPPFESLYRIAGLLVKLLRFSIVVSCLVCISNVFSESLLSWLITRKTVRDGSS
jgi:hypothetical protein